MFWFKVISKIRNFILGIPGGNFRNIYFGIRCLKQGMFNSFLQNPEFIMLCPVQKATVGERSHFRIFILKKVEYVFFISPISLIKWYLRKNKNF